MNDFIKDKFENFKIKNHEKLNEYIEFCIVKNNGKHLKRQTENHHILPNSLFPEYSDLSVHKWNSTFLYYNDHYIAHSLLAECIDDKRVIFAWWNMNSQNNNKIDCPEYLIGEMRYKFLREQHFDILSNYMKNRNKTRENIEKRLFTLSKKDESGLSGFQKQGKKISKTLKEKEVSKGENNPMFAKITVKERLNPVVKLNVHKDYDKIKYVHHRINFLELYDNSGNLYFSGWKDECIEYCDSIGLQGSKLNEKRSNNRIFVYNDGAVFVQYLLQVMELAGLSKYLNGYYKILSDEEIITYFKNKEAPDESLS